MVRLTRIYTKTGDDGTTALGDNSRTSKNDPRLEAFATVDEANSNIGVVVSTALESEISKLLTVIQNDLFDVGADLCTPVVDSPEYEPLRITEEQITWLESMIDKYNASLAPLQSFVLPSGTPTSAQLHVARTVVRRAERETWRAISQFGAGVNPLTAKYLNRLSDLLFVLARWSNQEVGDILWMPGKNRNTDSTL
jgi:cob(I)alamin adenosyltransferase